jgi:hypothetical protein
VAFTRAGRGGRACRGFARGGPARALRRGFAEYCESFTGEQLGSDGQFWTAAGALDWLAADGAA